jgi:hypothetical protein
LTRFDRRNPFRIATNQQIAMKKPALYGDGPYADRRTIFDRNELLGATVVGIEGALFHFKFDTRGLVGKGIRARDRRDHRGARAEGDKQLSHFLTPFVCLMHNRIVTPVAKGGRFDTIEFFS